MSKEILLQACKQAQDSNYKWELYYFKVNRKRHNPYVTAKVRFKQDSYINDYAKSLLNTVQDYQLKQVSEVQEYNGENTKVSCDKLSLSNDIIEQNWNLFYSSIIKTSEERFKGNVHGYFLLGKPLENNEKGIVFFKIGNPFVKLSTKKASFYCNVNDELELVNDEYCRLYLTADFIIYDNNLYAFNLNFEKIFDIEKTLLKIKEKGIDIISATDSISNVELFRNYAGEYKSPRTFVTIKQERIERIRDENKREEIAAILGLTLDEDKRFIIDTPEKTSLFIRYLCYRIMKDYETNDVVEVSNVTKLEI